MADPKAAAVTDTGGWQYGCIYVVTMLGSATGAAQSGTLVGIDHTATEASGAIGLWLRAPGRAGAKPFYVGLGAGVIVHNDGTDSSYRDPFAVEAPL